MSRRKIPRRSAARACQNFAISSESNSSDESDATYWDTDLYDVLLDLGRRRNSSRIRKPRTRTTRRSVTATHEGTSGTRSRRGGTPRGCGAKTRGRGARSPGRGQTQTSTLVGHSYGSKSSELASDIEIIEDDVKSNQQKDIENKVNNFFKSGNLMSDDDDDDLSFAKTVVTQPQKEPKEFYLLSDSDDEPALATNIKNNSMTETVKIEHNSSAEVTHIKPKPNDSDELMDLVDKILDCDDTPLEINTQPDKSWTEFKSRTEEILGSVNALLGELKGPEEAKKEEVAQKSPEKLKPSCPVCLEILGGNVIAASTMCGHIFCQECIKKVAKTTKICPTCRKRVNPKQIHPLYL